jgi:hypothetical protein
MDKPHSGDFCITIDFDKNSPNPERVFLAMSSMISAFKILDDNLIKSIDAKIQPVLMLEDIQTGSIKTWLRQFLTQMDDDGLKTLDWKPFVGQYLVKAKYIIIKFLDGKAKITNSAEVKILQQQLHSIAEETGVLNFPSYSEINTIDLIDNIDKINRSLSTLGDNDKAYFISSEGDATFNMDFNFSPEDIEDMLTTERIENVMSMILKVKKPDYLGSSRWEFKHDNRTIQAKVLDEEWIFKFQNRHEDIRPGDSLKAKVKITAKYGADGNVLSIQHDILTVEKVIRIEPNDQKLF